MKEEKKDALQEILERLEQGVKDFYKGDKFQSYLNTLSKFHNYSLNNTLLIAMQKPEASLVAGYNAWKNNFNRQVQKGEKAIKILAPTPYKTKKMIDKVILINDEDAINMSKKIALELGIGVGISSGANMLASVLAKEENKGNVVTVFPDDNKKYLSTELSNPINTNENYISNKSELLDYEFI